MSFYIEEICAVGSSKPDATINLCKGVNIISGPSNTGKTIIAKCLHFIFGKDINPFGSITDYNGVKLTINHKGLKTTLYRKVAESKIEVTSEDKEITNGLYTIKKPEPLKSDSLWINLLMLKFIGINEYKELIFSSNNERRALTWKNIYPNLVYISETKILTEGSIFIPENYTEQTFMYSILLFLIYGEEFKDAMKHDKDTISRAKKRAKIQVNTEYLNTFRAELIKKSKALEGYQNVDIEEKIKELTQQIDEINSIIFEATNKSKEILSSIASLENQLLNLNSRGLKYKDLKTQYTSNIKRLSFVVDGYNKGSKTTSTVKCPVCERKMSIPADENYIEASRVELNQIIAKLEGLNVMIKELADEKKAVNSDIKTLSFEKNKIDEIIKSEYKPKLDKLTSMLKECQEVIAIKQAIEYMGEYIKTASDNITTLEKTKDEYDKFHPKEHFEEQFYEDIEEIATRILTETHYHKFKKCIFDINTFDLIVNGVSKATNQGKGYRSYLNTINSLVLREFLATKGTYSPNLLVIDSPLLGFKEGKLKVNMPDNMRQGIYDYIINSRKLGQIIIIENDEDVPNVSETEDKLVKVISFTHDDNEGRYGFLHGKYEDMTFEESDTEENNTNN